MAACSFTAWNRGGALLIPLIDVCSGLPSFVEENLADWMALGRYCPWSAILTGRTRHHGH
jgi:hypothetical protein